MKMSNGTVILQEVKSMSPLADAVAYTDIADNRVVIPLTVIIRLYELSKYDVEKRGGDWDSYCDHLMVKR
jgi:hypothetical protein